MDYKITSKIAIANLILVYMQHTAKRRKPASENSVIPIYK